MNDEFDYEHDRTTPARTEPLALANSRAVMVPVVPRGLQAGRRSALERQLEVLRIAVLREEQSQRHSLSSD